MKYFSVFGSFLLLVFFSGIMGCSSATEENYTKIVKSWENHDINDLMMKWGQPSDEYLMPNGNKMYTWLYVGGSLVTVDYNRYLNMVTANSITYWCKTTFTTDKNGRIINWQWQGNACRADDPDDK